jgi:transposase
MSDLFLLSDTEPARLEPFLLKYHRRPRVDGKWVRLGIIFINRNGLRWRDAPEEYGPNKTLYNRWKRGSHSGIFAQMMVGLAADQYETRIVMI